MKQFLRYGVSGTSYLLWCVLYYTTCKFGSLETLLAYAAKSKTESFYAVALGLASVPIGVIIHQLSVSLKNNIIGRIWFEFSDQPKHFEIAALNRNFELANYYLAKISNLNSFYYVRIDNLFIAPLLAFVSTGILISKFNCFLI
ncbi:MULTISPECIES: hypothetical protein [unclassified Carboxylicivirga]|uniref:hypothetical protein n=1 Tax=Carboxylicivirga TaxID=1628153 RepID=UPI003D34A819